MSILSAGLQLKLTDLEKSIATHKGSIIAFSGGIDSSLLLFLSRKVLGKDRTIGVISQSESLKTKDFELAKQFCTQYNIRLDVIHTNEISDNRYNTNPADRCFFCKTHLYSAIQNILDENPGYVVMNGTNVDDYGDYRPGLQAAKDHQIISPLADCNITKNDIRVLAKHFELMNWDKPASPCLSSRIPYNQTITIEKLKQIEQAEEAIFALGFDDVRVRHFGNQCTIEVKPDAVLRLKVMESEVSSIMKSIGFETCVIDDEGLVSGKLNRVLKL